MSFNTNEVGEAVCCIVQSGKTAKKSSPIIYLDDDEHGINSFKEVNPEQLKNAVLQMVPNTSKERDVAFVTGKSGSGKSHWCANYCKHYHRIFPNNPIWLFTTCDEDPAFDSLKYIQRYELDDGFLEEEFSINDFENTLTIFDDYDTIQNKVIKDKLRNILDMLLQTGRKKHASCLITSHLPCDGKNTKLILYEATSITFFLRGMGGRTLNYLLEEYLGLDKNQVKKVKDVKSRAITILKMYPQVVLGEKDLFLL
jgi:hypothetical protein